MDKKPNHEGREETRSFQVFFMAFVFFVVQIEGYD